ncbi:hypothetical protein M0D21_12895 [Aquimarina sp. D1M17]|uniref:hypothetical protein n=1 Tax=Aquimarina acroporae TaxID=2937283 RepID=UPI0020C0345A|nr:hypothetical protein [Aquimarina acroporae]MCK8522474.1 hypothetical protein [Aquimarina acroporae]
MKNLFFYVLCLGVVLTSCSSDDDSSGFAEVTYKLIEVNTDNPMDLNGDNIANRNETLETDCYGSSRIVLESITGGYNFTSEFGYLDTGSEVQSTCGGETKNASYQLSDSSLVFTYEDGSTQTFEVDGDQLKVSDEWTFFEGELTKKVELVYQKQ